MFPLRIAHVQTAPFRSQISLAKRHVRHWQASWGGIAQWILHNSPCSASPIHFNVWIQPHWVKYENHGVKTCKQWHMGKINQLWETFYVGKPGVFRLFMVFGRFRRSQFGDAKGWPHSSLWKCDEISQGFLDVPWIGWCMVSFNYQQNKHASCSWNFLNMSFNLENIGSPYSQV